MNPQLRTQNTKTMHCNVGKKTTDSVGYIKELRKMHAKDDKIHRKQKAASFRTLTLLTSH